MSDKRNTFVLSALVAGFLVLQTSPATYGQYLRGDVSNPKGSEDCNPCVNQVIHSVETLRNAGETMGFSWDDIHPPFSGGGHSHWQGIQRISILPEQGLSSTYFVVSSAHLEEFSRFAVVEMSSRSVDGFRLRSNRLERGRLTRHVPPNPLDRIIRSQIIRTDYNHPGGMQAIGKYLLVGSETSGIASSGSAVVSLFDLSNLKEPVWEKQIVEDAANSVGIVRLENVGYLMLRATSDAMNLDFYFKASSDVTIPDDWGDPFYRWNHSELLSELEGDSNWADLDNEVLNIPFPVGYQNINIVTECQTDPSKTNLFLIASHGQRCKDIPVIGELCTSDDFVDAYRLEIMENLSSVTITKVATRHMFPGRNSGEKQGDLQKAAGVYVSPENKLYFYATGGRRDGPNDSVTMIEFGPEVPRATVNTIEEAWVELYEDDNFRKRSIILDYVDRGLRDYDDFANIEEFVLVFSTGQEIALTSSVIFAIPVGYRLRLYEGRGQTGPYFDLNGTGRAERITNLSDVKLSDGRSASDKFRSAEWNGGQASEVWVDFNFSGSQQDGSFDNPYNSLNVGLAGVLTGGILKIKSGSSGETLTITKAVTLEAPGGPVIVGTR